LTEIAFGEDLEGCASVKRRRAGLAALRETLTLFIFLTRINTATLATDMNLLIIILVLAFFFSRVFNRMDDPKN